MSIIDVISDYSNKNLQIVPYKVLEMYNLKMLYLENNAIERLPEDIFDKLARLTWLDLRKNKLTKIPAGIAHHTFLETLLLQDNQIETLPNEIGLVPNLKVLQVSGNPLIYPSKEIIEDGLQSICSFLKQEYYKTTVNVSEDDEEHELSIVEPTKSTSQLSKNSEKISVRELLKRSGRKSRVYEHIMPVIDVKSLTKIAANENENAKLKNIYPTNAKKVHKITRSCSKISLRSHSLWTTKKKIYNEDKNDDNELKEIWLSRLKDLLADQEKILQQEKNLKALNKWRLDKKAEPLRTSLTKIPEAPFGLDPECKRMLSRKDLTLQIDKMIKKSKKLARKEQSKKVNIQKLIDQVVDQMKNMETRLGTVKSPRAEQAIASQQIESIVELHKKILELQATNAKNY